MALENMMKISKIPKRGTQDVKVISVMSGRTYEGTFHWRRRTLEDVGMSQRGLSELTGGATLVDDQMAPVLRAIADLTVVVEKAPDWWEEIRELADTGVILAVYVKYAEWLREPFRAERKAAAEQATADFHQQLEDAEAAIEDQDEEGAD